MKRYLKIMFFLFIICLITVFLLDNDGTYGLFAAFIGVPIIWNN